MKRFVRFIILAAIGFALGAVLAYIQGTREAAQKAPVVQEAQVAPVAPVAEQKPEAGLPPAAETPVTSETQAPAEAATTAPAVGGAFSLTDQNGQPVTQASWPGKFKLVFFGFTHCPDVCPAAMDKLTAALNTLGPDADKVQALFITTDPARDTPEAMKAYLANYNPSILGLTGTEEQIKQAEDAYKVYAAKVEGVDPANYMMDHSAYMYLMTEDDKALEIFKSEDTAEMLAEKIRAHLGTAAAPVSVPAVEAPVAETAPAPAASDEQAPATPATQDTPAQP